MAIYRLNNTIQDYAWGSTQAMTGLLGFDNPESKPMAELWMGAHPKAPSNAEPDGIPLNKLLESAPENYLGYKVSSAFKARLPYLFKVLAAAAPLSIQAHPNLKQAAEGFARENAAGIALNAFNRNYKDDNHKPEIICALSEYHAMRGFRPLNEIVFNFKKVMIAELENAITALEADAAGRSEDSAGTGEESAGLKEFFTVLMRLPDASKTKLINSAVEKAEAGELPHARWIKRFAELYPGDIGVLSPLYLNVVTLQPGQAMYLPAGVLHAYLEGTGMELMANSDNVLRGGLTPKHVDVPELLSTLSFIPEKPEILTPVKITDFESAYITPAPEFYLSRIELEDSVYELPENNYGPALPSIFICLKGDAEIMDLGAGKKAESILLKRGETAFASHGSSLTIKGTAVLYRASVPG